MSEQSEQFAAYSTNTVGSLSSASLSSFEEAVAAYVAAPNPLTLLCLNKRAIPLMEVVPQAKPWRPVPAKATATTAGDLSLACDFTAIRVVCDRELDGREVNRLCGCLAYALKATLATGDEALSEPQVQFARTPEDSPARLTVTLLEYAFDARRSIRTDPDPIAAFAAAQDYIRQGTPLRTTDREGVGTKNTRLLNGIGGGVPVSVLFYVR